MYIPLSNQFEVGMVLSKIQTRKEVIQRILNRIQSNCGYTITDFSYEVSNDREIAKLYERLDKLILDMHFNLWMAR